MTTRVTPPKPHRHDFLVCWLFGFCPERRKRRKAIRQQAKR